MSKVKNNKTFNYTKAIEELNQIVDYLENSDVSIDVAIEKFERGSELAQQIKEYLTNAQNKVEKIKLDYKI